LTGRVVVYAAAADDPGATLTWAGDGTEIYNVPSGADVGFIVGDAAGAATVTFDVTSSASVMWASGAIQLLPSPLDALGSGLIVARTLTGTSTIVSGNQTFPTTWYDLVIGQTDDLIWDPVNNRVYFTRAGWYMVSNSVLGDGTTPGTQTRTRALIYQNSSVAALDARADVANSSIGFLGSSICVPVYCSAGDYIEPGIWASGSNGLDITGESTATLCQFKVSLMNRSLA
jgi:hypothetical protein